VVARDPGQITRHDAEGTDIVDFGNDVLTGANVGKDYRHVTVSLIERFGPKLFDFGKENNRSDGHVPWLCLGVHPRPRISVNRPPEAAAAAASSYLGSVGRLPEIPHDVLIDPEGPALAAALIAGLLEGAPHADGLSTAC
jgi:ATP-dependent DNA helicase UvrD/PcrA